MPVPNENERKEQLKEALEKQRSLLEQPHGQAMKEVEEDIRELVEGLREVPQEEAANLNRLKQLARQDEEKLKLTEELGEVLKTTPTLMLDSLKWERLGEDFSSDRQKREFENRLQASPLLKEEIRMAGLNNEGELNGMSFEDSVKKGNLGIPAENVKDNFDRLYRREMSVAKSLPQHYKEKLERALHFVQENLIKEGQPKVDEDGEKIYGMYHINEVRKKIVDELGKPEPDFEVLKDARNEYVSARENYRQGMVMARELLGESNYNLGNMGNIRYPGAPPECLVDQSANNFLNALIGAAQSAKERNIDLHTLVENPVMLLNGAQEEYLRKNLRKEPEFKAEPGILEKLVNNPYELNPSYDIYGVGRNLSGLLGPYQENTTIFTNLTGARMVNWQQKDYFDKNLAVEDFTHQYIFQKKEEFKPSRLGIVIENFEDGKKTPVEAIDLDKMRREAGGRFSGQEEHQERENAELTEKAQFLMEELAAYNPGKNGMEREVLASKILHTAENDMERLVPERRVNRIMETAVRQAAVSISEHRAKEGESRVTNRSKVEKLCNLWDSVKDSPSIRSPETLKRVYESIRTEIGKRKLSGFRFLSSDYKKQQERLKKMEEDYKERMKNTELAKEKQSQNTKELEQEYAGLVKEMNQETGSPYIAKLARLANQAHNIGQNDREEKKKYAEAIKENMNEAIAFLDSSRATGQQRALGSVYAMTNGSEMDRGKNIVFEMLPQKEAERLYGYGALSNLVNEGQKARQTFMQGVHGNNKNAIGDMLLGEVILGTLCTGTGKEGLGISREELASTMGSSKTEFQNFLQKQVEKTPEYIYLTSKISPQKTRELLDREVLQNLSNEIAKKMSGPVRQFVAEKQAQMEREQKGPQNAPAQKEQPQPKVIAKNQPGL